MFKCNIINNTKEIKRQVSIKLALLAKKLYKGRNDYNGLMHVFKVRESAIYLCEKLNVTDITTLIKIEAIALFHHLWDYKYVDHKSDKYNLILKEFYNELRKIYFSDHDIKEIEIVINNISLSRDIYLRNKYIYVDLKYLQQIKDIVSDADRLQMLGKSGIDRIIKYEIYKNSKISKIQLNEVIKKIYIEKISKLLNENYIKTEPARLLAEPLIKEISNYIVKM